MARVLVPFPSVDVELARHAYWLHDEGGATGSLELHRERWHVPGQALTDRGVRESLAWRLWASAQCSGPLPGLDLDRPFAGVHVELRSAEALLGFWPVVEGGRWLPLGQLLLDAARDVMTRPAG